MKKRMLSGMRPTGRLHIGHLVGALSNWVKFQEKYESLFMVADWHALMSEYKQAGSISALVIDNVVDWLSCGIDPARSTIFVQSEVREHSELHLLLSVITPLGWLERCPTYKEQLKELKAKDIRTYGFLGYPVLQAADILLYKAEHVPVGGDQLPHLELCREIARRFNHLYNKEVFPEPASILAPTPKLLGIDNRKMSKSYENYIALSDSPNVIKEKAESMFTDPKRVRLSDPGHPNNCNVYAYYKIFAPQMTDEVFDYCTHARLGCTACKKNLANVLMESLSGIQAKRKALLKDKERISEILKKGAKKAGAIAAATIKEARGAAGL